MTGTISLASALGLRPLDRVQINSRETLREYWYDQGMKQPSELPFWFFQEVKADGQLLVRSPAGRTMNVNPEDICDVIPGEPILVKAMPTSVFVERLKLQHRGEAVGPECYADAWLQYVIKDRWGRADSIAVLFLDPAHNVGKSTFNPVGQAERERITKLARRTNMPVISGYSAAYSADHGVEAAANLNHAIVRRFIKAGVQGQAHVVERLTIAGAKPIKRPELNRLA